MSEKKCITQPVPPKSTRNILDNKKHGLAMTVQSATPSLSTSTPAPLLVGEKETTKPFLMNDIEAAAFLGISPHTLRKWRSTGSPGPAYVCVGRLKKYRLADLVAYAQSQTIAR